MGVITIRRSATEHGSGERLLGCGTLVVTIMGLFKKLGRQAEQFKRDMKSAAEETTDSDEPTYYCTHCETQFGGPSEHCPECNSTDIRVVQ